MPVNKPKRLPHTITEWHDLTKSRLKAKLHYIHDNDGNKINYDVSKGIAFNQFFTSVFVHEDCSNLPSFLLAIMFLSYVTLMSHLSLFITS